MKSTWLTFVSLVWGPLVFAQTFAPDINQCPRLAPRERPPTGVNDLRPDDIGVIAAIGDSITAGFLARGANTPYVTISQYKEDRGVSFSMGGDRDAVTLPNILEHYTRGNLQGASVGSRDPVICEDDPNMLCDTTEYDGDDHFNAAHSGDTSKDFTRQAQYLIERIGHSTSLDNEWKVLTIYLGANDIFRACQADYNAAEFEKRMRGGLQLLKQNIKNVYINLIAPPPASVFGITNTLLNRAYVKPTVPPVSRYGPQVCPCCYEGPAINALGLPISPVGQGAMMLEGTAFKASILKLAKEFADTRPDATFTVAFHNLDGVPTSPTYFSNIDGMHPSKKAHAFLAKLLWNNMFRKEVSRPLLVAGHQGEQVRCPTESDRFQA